MAKPKIYDPKTLWDDILTKMAEGKSLSAILRQEGMPSYSYCKEKLREDPDLRRRYDQSIEDRADRLADELIELAWTPPPKDLDGRGMSAWVQHLRVKIDVLKWTASKLKPRTWGDRLDVSVTHEQISITQVLEEARARVDSLANPKAKEVIDVSSKEV